MNFPKGILVFQTKFNTKSKVTLLINQNERDKSENLYRNLLLMKITNL